MYQLYHGQHKLTFDETMTIPLCTTRPSRSVGFL